MNKKFLLPVLVAGSIPLLADVKMPAIFSDHAVLQKSHATVIFGKADVNEKVSVKYGNASAAAVADKNGRFEVTLDLSKDDGKSKKLLIEGKNKIVIKEVEADEAIRFNSAMIKSASMPTKRNDFFNDIESRDFYDVIHKYCKTNVFIKICKKIRSILNIT